MLKKLSQVPTVDVMWRGEVVCDVHGLSPADLSSILLAAGEELAGLVDVTQEIDKLGLTVAGFVRGSSLNLYAHPHRVRT